MALHLLVVWCADVWAWSHMKWKESSVLDSVSYWLSHRINCTHLKLNVIQKWFLLNFSLDFRNIEIFIQNIVKMPPTHRILQCFEKLAQYFGSDQEQTKIQSEIETVRNITAYHQRGWKWRRYKQQKRR